MFEIGSVDFSQFHFLRPHWLWGCLPAVLLCFLLWRKEAQSGRWSRAIDANLLPHLLENVGGGRKRWPLLPLLLAWLLALVAIAGPVWEKLPQPVSRKEDALVIIQDLSLSLYAEDLSPNRLTRAIQKLGDILHARKEGTTALVVYSGSAYVVAPLTDDTRTIEGMLTALSPEIMPNYGSNPVEAVTKALQLFKDAGVSHGRLLLISDEVSEADVEGISDLMGKSGSSLSVLGVGTEDGGPIPLGEGGYLKDSEGTIIVPRMNSALLKELAVRNNGRYSEIRLTDQDIDYLLAEDSFLPKDENYRKVEREFDQWREMGGWLVLLILPVALFSFRRGWLLGLALLVPLWGTDCRAMGWQDLWQRPDQQAASALSKGDTKKAAELFETPQWKGTAQYQAGDYNGAVESFGRSDTADGHYNHGNALAKSGRLEEAIAAYEQALKIHPDMADAVANMNLVKKLLEEQQKNEQENQDQQDKGDKSGKDQKQQQGKDNKSGQDNKQQDNGQGQNQEGQGDKQQKGQEGQKGKADDRDSVAGDQNDSKQQAAAKEQADKPEGKDGEKAGQEAKDDSASKKSEAHAQAIAGEEKEPLSEEEQQAMQQWLRQIPDNPGGLLQRKFEYEYSKKRDRQDRKQEGKIW